MSKRVLYASLGGASGVFAAAPAWPFRATAFGFERGIHGPFADVTLGSLYAPVFDILFGSVLCATLTFLVTTRRGRQMALPTSLLAACVGGAASLLADSVMDFVHSLIGASRTTPDDVVLSLGWVVGLGVVLPATIILSAGLSKERCKCSAWATMIVLISSVTVVESAAIVPIYLLVTGPQRGMSPRQLGDWSLFAWIVEAVVLGAVVGIAVHEADGVFATAAMRSVGERIPGRIWVLDMDVNRVGSSKHADVRLPAQGQPRMYVEIASQRGHFIATALREGYARLNGVPLGQERLEDGDIIEVPGGTLEFLRKPRSIWAFGSRNRMLFQDERVR